MTASNLDAERKQAELLFEQWSSSLRSKDRTRAAVPGNFEELFEALKRANISFEVAHDILPKAIKAHQPNNGLIRNYYKLIKNNCAKTEQEFAEEWRQNIKDAGTEAFYIHYTLTPKEEDEDPEPKVYGNMSAREYRLQRRHAESFPILDTSKLEERLRRSVYNPVEDLDNVFGDNDGNKVK